MKAVIICLNQKFGALTGEALAQELNLTYANCNDAISAKLAKDMVPLQDFSLKDLETVEREVVKDCLKCDIVSIDYDLFARHRVRIKQNIIYLQLPEDKVDKLNKLAYSTRDLRLKNLAKHVIKADTTQNAVRQIKNETGEER